MSGRLPYHVNQINIGPQAPGAGVARNMTMIPRKLKQAGYSTHMIGKVCLIEPNLVDAANLISAALLSVALRYVYPRQDPARARIRHEPPLL